MPAFPTFTNGVVSQYPGYDETDRFYTLQARLGCGISYTKSLNPANPVRVFRLTFAQFSKDEMLLLEGFYLSVGGRVMTFSFIDDDGVQWPSCRFLSDDITWQYTEQNGYGATCQIEASLTSVLVNNQAASGNLAVTIDGVAAGTLAPGVIA